MEDSQFLKKYSELQDAISALKTPQPHSALSLLLSGASNTVSSSALDYFNTLGTLASKPKKHKQYFLGQTVNIDGIIFEECRFDDCTLHSETGDINFKNCVLGQNTKISLGTKLLNIAKFLSLVEKSFPSDWKPTFKTVANLTTVSIP